VLSLETTPESIILGYVSRAFGLKGGVFLKLINRESDALMVGKRVTLKRNKTADLLVTIAAIQDRDRIFFTEVNDRTAAEALRGAEVWISHHDLPASADDEYYLFEIMGASVIDTHGNKLGDVVGFSSNNAQTLIDIKTTSGHVASVPNVKPLVKKIDTVQKVVIIDPPEGLLDVMD
jgi:16S rRNA processing protein RimM